MQLHSKENPPNIHRRDRLDVHINLSKHGGVGGVPGGGWKGFSPPSPLFPKK